MTFPPSNQPPSLPGASSWAPQQPPPTFISPAAPSTMPAQFELAGWGLRFAAYGIDQVVRLVIAIAISIAGFVALADEPFSYDENAWNGVNEATGIPSEAWTDNNLIWIFFVAAGIYLVLALIYAPVFMAMWRGATPGKRMCGIRVVRENGADVSFGTAFLREPVAKGLLINGIGGSFFLPMVISYLWPLWDRECRAGHDFLAKTRVIKSRP